MPVLQDISNDRYIDFTTIDVTDLNLGYQIIDQPTGNFWVLASSPATIDHINAETVKNRPDLRWLKTGQTTGQPISGGGPGLNPTLIYVSPLGDDKNDGSSWERAVKTGYHGMELLNAANGGTLNLANGVSWVDNDNLQPYQVAGQGIWLRNDPVGSTDTHQPSSVIGFLRVTQAVNVIGWGNGFDHFDNPFQEPGIAHIAAGSNLAADYRTKPGLWLIENTNSISFNNIRLVPSAGFDDGEVGLYCSYRAGWDYNRNSDPTGTIAYQTIHNATRTGTAGNGQTTFTVDLSPPVTFAIGNVKRYQSPNLGNAWVVHCTFHRTVAPEVAPWKTGSGIWFDTADGQFTPGAYTVAWQQAVTLSASDWDIEFIDGSSTPAVSVATATVRSTVATPIQGQNAQLPCYVEVEGNTSTQFPATVYPVISVAATSSSTGTITVKDIYGGYSGINVTQGLTTLTSYRLVHQERDFYSTAAQTHFVNCTGRATQNPAKLFRMGNMFDFGSTAAFPPELYSCYLQGFKPLQASGIPYDDMRMSAFFGQGGGGTPCGFTLGHLSGQQASVRLNMGGTTCSLYWDTAIFDTDNQGEPPAAFVIYGDSAVSPIRIDNIGGADSNPGFGNDLNEITGVPAGAIQGNSAVTKGQASCAPSSNTLVIPRGESSPWRDLQIGTWAADLQITGKHPAAWRNISPTSKRFAEFARAPGSYSPTPLATGIADPLGGTNAVSYDASDDIDISVYIHTFDHTFTFVPGDRLIVCGWANAHRNAWVFGQPAIVVHTFSNTIWDLSGSGNFSINPPILNEGWQFVSGIAQVTAGSASTSLQVAVNKFGASQSPGAALDMFGWSVYYVPASSGLTDGDVYEYLGTLRAAPQYLAAGMAGTFETQKFIAHGGLGTSSANTKVVGAGSGQLTLLGTQTYLPLYAADGTTIITWIRGENATVNP